MAINLDVPPCLRRGETLDNAPPLAGKQRLQPLVQETGVQTMTETVKRFSVQSVHYMQGVIEKYTPQ
eukprot:6477922-Amphidinium_carterae.1